MLKKIEEKEETYMLNSCCSVPSDKRLLIFVSSLMISLIVLVFSCYQLTRNLGCNSDTVYVSLITSILSIWIPSPVSK